MTAKRVWAWGEVYTAETKIALPIKFVSGEPNGQVGFGGYVDRRHVIDPSNLDPAMVRRAAEAIAKSRGEEFDEYLADWMDDARGALVAALTVEGGGG